LKSCHNHCLSDIRLTTMRWLHLIYYFMLYLEKALPLYSTAYFTMIANLEFTVIPMQHFCGISAINCASECNTDVGCSAFNYNHGTRICRLLRFDLFNQTAWPDFAQNEEWTVYLKQTPHGNTL